MTEEEAYEYDRLHSEYVRLTAENAALRKDRDDLLQQALGVEAERDIARMENERLLAALEPFARAGLSRSAKSLDFDGAFSELSIGDLGRAATAYQQNALHSEEGK